MQSITVSAIFHIVSVWNCSQTVGDELCLFAIYNESHFEVGCHWKIVIWIRIWKVRFPFLCFLCSEKKPTFQCWHLKVWGGPFRKSWIEKGSAHHLLTDKYSLSASSKIRNRYGFFLRSKNLVMLCLISVWQSLPVQFIILQIGVNETAGPNHINVG